MKKKALALALVLILLLSAAECALATLPCGACRGTGRVRCSACGGDGYVLRGTARTGYVKSPCGSCHQSGEVSCRACGGDGQIGSGDPGTSGGGGSGERKADISKTSLTLVAGRSETLKVNWASGTVKWSSSNSSVATVSSGGKVKARKAGSCTITARTGSQTLTCKVKVKKKVYAQSIKLNKSKATLLPGGSIDLSYKVSPDASKITESWSVSFSSSDKNVATVNKEGHVSAKNPGTATITAKLKYKDSKYKKVKCSITVESGLARFKRWFKKNCSSVDGKKVYYSGDNDRIIYDSGNGTWTFFRHEDNYNGYDEVSITFNSDFTGNAYVSYYWYRSGAYTGVNETECTATQSVKSLSQYTRYDWNFTKGSSSEREVADATVTALLSGMHVMLRDEARLNAKVGWRDLGLKAY